MPKDVMLEWVKSSGGGENAADTASITLDENGKINELLFDKTQLILKEPTFQWSKDYVIDIFYYFLSKQIQAKGKVSALAYFCIIVCIVFLLKNLFRYLALFVLAPLRNQLIFDLRHQLYEKTLKLPISFFQEEKKDVAVLIVSTLLRASG